MITPSKRGRLVEAAKTMFYQQGVTRSTLADIAEQAQVPLGNVYYHFRTKDVLIEAVIEAYIQELRTMFACWEQQYSNPRQRLLAMLALSREEGKMLVRYGSPYGSLCQELDKDDNQLARIASQLLQVFLDWIEVQFRLLGKTTQEAHDGAIDLISSLQGIFLLTNSFLSSSLLERKLQRMETWIGSL